MEQRAIRIGKYIVDNNSTTRKTGDAFGISRQTVLNDVSKLENLDNDLFKKVKNVFNKNFAERHSRGGLATHNKYKRAI